MSPQNPQLPPGTLLFGTYEITGVLGGGGMGWVYRAVHRTQGSPRAIKVIRPDMVSDPALRQLFNREAAALLKIQNEAIVRCFDQLQDENGVYLVMELVQGESLEEILKDGPLNVGQVISLKRRVAQGLAAAHAAGVVHRDISPGNIILPGGRVEDAKLIDFGVAAVASAADATIAGFKGKLAYASPEQFGLYDGKIGPPSDIYSFGLVLVESAGGRPMPMGQTFYEALEIRKAPPKLPLTIPPELAPEIEPMIQPDPKRRPSAEDMLRQKPVTPPPPSVPSPSPYAPPTPEPQPAVTPPRSRAVTWLYSGSAILVGILLGCYVWIYRSAGAASGSGTPSTPAPGQSITSPSQNPPATTPGSSGKSAVPAAKNPPPTPAAPTPTAPKPAAPSQARAQPGAGITRVAMIARADEYAAHTWTCGAHNQKGSCARPQYHSSFQPNQNVQGVPYRWGGIDGPEELPTKLKSGYAAGSHSWDGVLSCATGVDCSGFVSQCWGKRGKHDYSTANLSSITTPVTSDVFTSLKPGDALNLPGSHVVLFAGYQKDGRPIVYEASGPASRVIKNTHSTWARFKRYQALRFRNVVE